MSEPCRFLALPPEIRDQIYTYLCGNQVIRIRGYIPGSTWAYVRASTEEGLPLHGFRAMLLISRQVTREATHIIYSTNQFCFHRAPELRLFNELVPRRNLASVRNLKLALSLKYPSTRDAGSKSCTISELATQMPNLVHIHLELSLGLAYRESSTKSKGHPSVLKESVKSSTAFPNLRQGIVVLNAAPFRGLFRDYPNLSPVEQWLQDEFKRGCDFIAGAPVKVILYDDVTADAYDPSCV